MGLIVLVDVIIHVKVLVVPRVIHCVQPRAKPVVILHATQHAYLIAIMDVVIHAIINARVATVTAHPIAALDVIINVELVVPITVLRIALVRAINYVLVHVRLDVVTRVWDIVHKRVKTVVRTDAMVVLEHV